MASLKNIFRITSNSFRLFRYNSVPFKTHKKNFSGAYDPDGKTVVNIMNSDEDAPLMIDGYSSLGFRLNNGIFVVGPIAIFPNSILSWNVGNDDDINENSLSLFLNLSPKLDILVVGVSDPMNKKLVVDINRKVHDIIWKKGYDRINVEVLPTEKAVTTFNFLNSESRFVGGAMLPPVSYSFTLEDEFRIQFLSKKREKNLLLDK